MEVRAVVGTRPWASCSNTLLDSYFRHWLNWVMLYSVWFEFDLMPYVD